MQEDTVYLVKREVVELFKCSSITKDELVNIAATFDDPDTAPSVLAMRERGMTVTEIVDYIVLIARTTQNIVKKFN